MMLAVIVVVYLPGVLGSFLIIVDTVGDQRLVGLMALVWPVLFPVLGLWVAISGLRELLEP
jgi:hypothetical protein